MVNWLRPFQRRAVRVPGSDIWLDTRTGLPIERREIHPRISSRTDGRDVLINTPDGWEVSAPWYWFNGPDDGSVGPFGNPPPGAFDPLGYVSIPAVTRATSLICDQIAALPWKVYRNEYERIEPTPTWITDPQNLARDGRLPFERGPELIGSRLSAVEFWTEWLVSMLWFGNGYCYVPLRGTDGQPQPPMWILNPEYVTIEDHDYYVNGEYLPSSEIIHLRGLPPFTDGYGQGVLTRHGLDVSLAHTVRKYAQSQYQSGIPYGYIKSSQPRMDDVQAESLRDKWMQQHGQSGRRKIAVLNATTDFVPLTITPLDAQLSDARTWSLRDIAMAFGIPPYMLGVSGDTSTYANVEGRHREYLTFTLLPHIRKIESTLEAQLPRGTKMRVETAGFERADTMTRANVYKTLIESGVMTRDEAREREHLAPLGEENDPLIPTPVGANDGQTQPPNGTAETQPASADSGGIGSPV